MKLIAKNTIVGLKANPNDSILPGEGFECDIDTAFSLLESDAAVEADEEEPEDIDPDGN
jgi:hypothetical protein